MSTFVNVIRSTSRVGRVLKFNAIELSSVSSKRCICSRVTSLSSPHRPKKEKNKGHHREILDGSHFPAANNALLTPERDTAEYKVKGDPDTFGNYGDVNTFDSFPRDKGDQAEDDFLENPPHPHSKLRTKQYADMIKRCIREKRFADAIDVLETKMLKEDRVKPENYIFNLLIGACGRWGYTKKAFQLYNQMKKRGITVNDPTYTGLFNACANSPWPEDGLKRATHLRELLIEKGIEFNTTHYHAMIKAFGHCGNLDMAFALVDEMVHKHLPLTPWTFNTLLQACIEDKEAGFRHSILVWRKMLQKKIKPDLFSYNLMLRSVRDCGIGDSVIAQNVLEQVSKSTVGISLPQGRTQATIECSETAPVKMIQGVSDQTVEVHGESLQIEDNCLSDINLSEPISIENRPNLLAPIPHLGNIIQISEVTRPQDRLLLIGGFRGILELMASNDLTPDIKTFTLLLDSIPPTISAENALLNAMKKLGIQCDIDFFNMLIKKRSMRYDYANAREVLRLIQVAKLHPDIVTFGVLALGCQKEGEAKQIIMDMRNAGFRMNAEILGAMLRNACIRHDFHYIHIIMNICKEEPIKPNEQFLSHLENFNSSCQEILKNKDKDIPEYVKSRSFKKDFRTFSFKYRAWLNEIQPEEKMHPWSQYRKQQPGNERQRRNSSNAL